MTTIIKATEVTRPEPDPLRSSVLDHARAAGNVTSVGSFGLRNEEGLWPSYNCLDLLVPTATCPDPTEDKTFDTAPWVPGFTFAVQGGVQCAAVGLDVADQRAEVKRVFEASEGKGVERALLANRFVARVAPAATPENLSQRGEWDAPVDVTPGETISVVVALALLEGYAAAVYAGRPTIHMPVAAATVLEASGLIVWTGDLAYTKNGSKVAMGGGYDDSTPPMTGEWDLFATGEVYVERSEQIDVSLYELTGVDDEDYPFHANTSLALAERMFRVGVDCFVAKATATLWS